MDFTCQVSFYDEIHSTIVKEHQLLMHKKNKTEYLFSRIQIYIIPHEMISLVDDFYIRGLPERSRQFVVPS